MLSGMTAFAALTEGFYRVSNYGSGRYLYVTDCTGSLSTVGTDFGALELWPVSSRSYYSDPASIIYLKAAGKDANGKTQWDLQSQGTGVHDMIGHYVTITETTSGCMLYQSGQYLYEIGTSDKYPNMGIVGAGTTNDQPGRSNYRVWPTHPITNTGNDFFGIQPYIQQGNKYYTTFFADFAYSPLDNVRTYSITHIDTEHAIAVYTPVTGTVAKQQPVIVECPTNAPQTNRLNLTTSAGTAASGNLLRGNFFCNGGRTGFSHPGNQAAVEFNPATMRMLERNSAGKLVMTNAPTHLVTQTIKKGNSRVSAQCIPANQAYLPVDASCPATLQLMTQAEYDQYIASITPVVTRDTTRAIVGTLTSNRFCSLPYSVDLPVDTILLFRIATIIRSTTTMSGQTISVQSDTTYRGATSLGTSVTRDHQKGGFLLNGTYPIKIRTDAAGIYSFQINSIGLLTVSFPDLPAPTLTRDTLYSILTDAASAWTPLPLRRHTFTLPTDSIVDFHFARVVTTTSRVTIYPPTITRDTLFLGAEQPDEPLLRDSTTTEYPLFPSVNDFLLIADTDGDFTVTLLSESSFSVTYPTMPVTPCELENTLHIDSTDAAVYDYMGRRYPSDYQSLPAGLYIIGRTRVMKVNGSR